MIFFEISLRYFFHRKRRGGVSLISFVSLAGISLGIISLTIVVSVMNGFDRELKKRILGVVPHVVVNASLATWDKAAVQFEENLLISENMGAFLEVQAMLVHQMGNELITLYGVQPDEEVRLSVLDEHLIEGSLDQLTSGSLQIFLGEPQLTRLGMVIGDKVNLVIPKTNARGNTVKPSIFSVRIAGAFQLGSELDYRLAYMHIDDLVTMTGAEPALRIKVADIFLAESMAEKIREETAYPVETWGDKYGDFFKTVKMEKTMMFILMSIIIAVAAFNIISSLSIMVVDKKGDIAILRTMGASEGNVLGIFLLQGAIIGVIGLLLGMGIGIPLASHITEVISFFEDLSGSRVLAGTYFDRVPSEVRTTDIVLIGVFSLLITLIATLGPAMKAAKLQPATVLKSD